MALLTWDEPEASAGASQAVTYDIDLWADPGASCTPDAVGQCGAWASQSNIDNIEYLIIDNPPPGVLPLKAINWRAPSFGLPVAIAAKIIRGDPTPAISMSATPSTTSPAVGSSFTVTTSVASPAYEAYGVQVSAAAASSGLSLLGVSTTREDGVGMDFPNAASLDSWHGDGATRVRLPGGSARTRTVRRQSASEPGRTMAALCSRA